MRQLIVIRHAKSDWTTPGLADHDRPLNARGRRDAPIMGQRLFKQCSTPQILISSSALRARTTASMLAAELGYADENIQVDSRLYGASAVALLGYLRGLNDENQQVALVAHNPGVTDLVNILSGQAIENMPTASFAVLNLEVDHWQEVGPGKAELRRFDYPKKPG